MLKKKANKLKERNNVTLLWCTVCKNKMDIRFYVFFYDKRKCTILFLNLKISFFLSIVYIYIADTFGPMTHILFLIFFGKV
jgi:hypothetical protein